MKRGIKSDYCIMIRGKHGIYFEPVSGRKIILKKNNKILYVGYRKNYRYFEFTDLKTGFLIRSDINYTVAITEIFIDFDKIYDKIEKTKQKFLQEVNQLQMANDIFRLCPLSYNESAVIDNV